MNPRTGQPQATLHRVAHRGRTVCWHQTGDGPPLVLLHGGHGSWQHWVRNMAALATRFSVWVPDMPGYGESDAPLEPTLASLMDVTLGTLDQLVGAQTPVHLAGFSFGGLVASHVAVQRQAVRGLALLGTAGHGGVRRPSGKLRAWRTEADAGDPDALAGVMRHNLGVHMLHDPDRIDELALQLHTQACLNTRFHSKTISRAPVLGPLLNRYRGPLLMVWGQHDVTAQPEGVAAVLSSGRTRCRTQIVPDAGHWVQYEQADAVNALLLNWLDSPDLKVP